MSNRNARSLTFLGLLALATLAAGAAAEVLAPLPNGYETKAEPAIAITGPSEGSPHCPPLCGPRIFRDGFETGDTSEWAETVGGSP